MPRSIDASRPEIRFPTRRSALQLLGLAGGLIGVSAVPVFAKSGPAAVDAGADVLTEGGVLRDPEIPATGNVKGDITIVEYFDFQCPYCRKIAPELQQVVQDDGKVRLVYKDWPVLGPVSKQAARMVLAAKYQDKYIAAHDALMDVNSRLTEAKIREALAGAGIDVDRASRDLETNAKAIDAILARNDAQATAFGFKGTPSFIIGKFRVPGVLTMAQFDQAIADARKAAKKKN